VFIDGVQVRKRWKKPPGEAPYAESRSIAACLLRSILVNTNILAFAGSFEGMHYIKPGLCVTILAALPVTPRLGEGGVKRQYFDGRSPYNFRDRSRRPALNLLRRFA